MSHPTDTKDQFVELCALGQSAESAAAQLGISRATAFRWARQLAPRIHNLRVLRLEAVQTRVLGCYEDRLKTAVARLTRYEVEMDSRQAKYFDMKELQMLINDARKQVEKLTLTPRFVEEPPEESPAAEPSTQ